MARILIVDDDESVLRSIQVLMTSENYEAVIANNGEEALELLRTEKFDVLLTDIRMAPLDGMDLMRLAHEIKPDLPVIVVSAFSSDESKKQGFNMGCVAYIKKPFKIQEVTEAINKAINKNSAES